LPYILYAKNIQHYYSKLILANSHFTAEAISQSINADARVLYPPISISFFENDNNISASKQRENQVVSIGRLTEDKKMEIIPHIASLIKEKRVKFLIIGFAHSNKAIEKINENINTLNLKDKVRILTNVPRSKVKKILQRAKVYLHPPTIEHFGISIAEAMASGCIPVVYNIGGVREFVPKEFRYKNLYEAAEKVERALNYWSPKEARRMNLIAQKFAEPNFRKNFYKMFSEYLSRRKTEETLSQRFINVRRKKEILNGF
jgi:glycosyltransferase involved in cell wall biosynthesis